MTQSTTTFSRGDVVVVDLLYPDQRGSKHRPALVVSSAAYHAGRQEVVLAGLTSNVRRRLPGDTHLADWASADLPLPSVVTGILQTVKRSAVMRALGSLSARDLRAVEDSLREALVL